MQTETRATSATFSFPIRVLLLVSSRADSIGNELEKYLQNSVVTIAEPSSSTYMKEMLGRNDVVICDTKSYEYFGEDLQAAVTVSHVPFILLIRQSEEQKVLNEICPTGLLWDYVQLNDIKKIPFVISRFYESVSDEIHSDEISEIRYQFRIKKLTDQNLLLMDQLSEKDRILSDILSNEQKFRKMVEDSGDVVYTTNYKGEFTYLNPRVEMLTGYTITELLGKHYLELVHPDQRSSIEAFYYNQFKNFIDETVKDFTIICKNGEVKWVEQTVRLVREGDRVKGFQCIVRDVNERKKYEQKLYQHATLLEKTNKELEMFAYVASHDLKEPLRKITTFSSRVQALPEMKNLTEKGRDYLARMNSAAKRMEVMIEDLLAYSRVSRSRDKFKTCDLNKVLHRVIGDLEPYILRTNANIEAMQLPVITAIESQIASLLMNLLSNALKFSKKDQSPDIKILVERIPCMSVPCSDKLADTEYIKLCVKDQGIGFDNKYCDRIFEIFQRLHGKSDYPGTGIGLAIVRKIAERHKGCVKASGIIGVGAEFHVFLPIHQQDEPLFERKADLTSDFCYDNKGQGDPESHLPG